MPTKFVERKETGEQSLWGGNIFYKGSDYVSTSDTTAGRSRSRANMIFHFMCALRNYADSTRHAFSPDNLHFNPRKQCTVRFLKRYFLACIIP